nr:N-formylglutamate amidohydrolase [Amaricoccus macauensis]
MDDAFKLAMPADRRSCAVFSSPHSGREYPVQLIRRSRLSLPQLRSSEDAFVDELFAAAPDAGAPLLAARAPRAWVDLNRGPEDLDPALIAGAGRVGQNPRIAAGLGVIPRVVGEGRAIIDGKLSLAEAESRILTVWRPYHARLTELIEESRAAFGMAVLFDCHSMPRDALNATPSAWGRRPNVILGDRFGAACDRWLIDLAADVFGEAGFLVARNTPFAGGYITQTYGRPRRGVQALQIEIDRSLYMDEARVERGSAFAAVAARLTEVTRRLAAIAPRALPMAAE